MWGDLELTVQCVELEVLSGHPCGRHRQGRKNGGLSGLEKQLERERYILRLSRHCLLST